MYTSKSIFLFLKSRKMSQKIPTLVLDKKMKRKVKFDVPASTGSVANQKTLKPPTEKTNQGNPFHACILQSRYFSPSNQEKCLRKSQLWF